MYCTYCGGQLREGSEFCTKCGQKLSDGYYPQEMQASAGTSSISGTAVDYAEPPVLQIKCVSCDKAIADQTHPVNNCPYCGTSQLPSVYPGQTGGHGNTLSERRAARHARRAVRAERWSGPGRRALKAVAIVSFAIAAFSFITVAAMDIANSSSSYIYREEIVWPSSGLAQMLPEMDSYLEGYIQTDSSEAFVAEVYQISRTTFNDYADQCRNIGFDVDVEKDNYSFSGYNEEGYKLELDYYDFSDDEMRISLSAPMEMRPLRLADKGLAALLPELPEGAVGRIEMDSASYISFYVGETSREDFDEYVTACISGGFDVDYSRSNDYFYGENDDGSYITVNYLGNKTMQVNISD